MPGIGPPEVPARPCAELGVFSTLLVREGVALNATEHIARLTGSARVLFGQEPAIDLEAWLAEVARDWDLARLRVAAAPEASGSVTVAADVEPLDPRPDTHPCVLAPVTVAGGLGPHKWRDRRLLVELERATGAVPLLMDVDGHVLEAAHANIFVVEGMMVVTPPLDGRLLPGVIRARLLKVACEAGLDAREEIVTHERLAAADELLLTSSLRGVHPAQLRGRGPGCFELGARLRVALG